MKKSKILSICAIACAGILALSSCSNKNKDAAADSDTAVATEEAAPQEQKDSLALFFENPSKKADTPSDSTYMQTASGLKYIVVKEGTGATPTATDNVTVHYTGRLLDGTVFDTSTDRGEPITFPLNRVIPGWTEGLQYMKEGGKAIFFIPSNLAYGEQGTPGGPIGPNQDLIFDVELIKVN